MRPRRLRVVLAGVAVALLLAVLGLGPLIRRVAGAFERDPLALAAPLSAAAQALVRTAYEDIDPARLTDFHVHVVGLGQHGSGAWVNPVTESWLHPVKRIRFLAYIDAAGVSDLADADAQYWRRFRSLVDALPMPGRYHLLAFDLPHQADGTPDREHAEIFVPLSYVEQLAAADPTRFAAAASVHPDREGALADLEAFAARGGRLVKWLPNAMHIDPGLPRYDAFYATMARHGLVLLTHGGAEYAVDAGENQRFGNPLRLRRPLERGVTVIVAHCAGLGMGEDLDDPAHPEVPNFDLFMRLMDEPRFFGRLYGEISAVTQANRVGDPLRILLERRDLHPRLVNGSDYPLPAINVLFQTGLLERGGYLTAGERQGLNELYVKNPLLFDFVLKRTVHAPQSGARFSPQVFFDQLPSPPTLPTEETP